MDLIFGAYRLSEEERMLAGPTGAAELSARSVDILKLFLERPNALIGKSELMDAVWPGVVVEENTLQVHMSALRKALGPGLISTVHGRGYRYVGPVPQAATAPSSPPSEGGNLGRYRVDCVARDTEKAAVLELLGRQRLVSILGAGGVGKTTLALAVAAHLSPRFDAVWVIDLAPLADAALVESTIIQTLGIPFRANIEPLRAITDTIGRQKLLLVFDNCEHVAAAVAQVAKTLLAEAPNLSILTTTQVPLGITEEHLFRLAPFGLDGASLSAQSAQFLAYCYEVLGEQLAPDEMPIVAQLCRRLDGVALALKMAAARAATLGIAAVDRQIAEQMDGLAAGWEPSLARHRSLLASLRWSYELLADADRKTLRALGVFQGSFTLDGVRAVAGAGSDDSISELVRRSIVVRDGMDRSRYRLLETTRHFALDRLAEAGEAEDVRARHADYVLGVFRKGLDDWETIPDREWLAALQIDADNLRSALDWSKSHAAWPVHVGLAACTYRFWIQTQLPSEGLAHAEGAFAHEAEAPRETQALLGLALGELYRFYWRDYRVLRHLKTAIAFYEHAGDRMKRVQTLALEGWSQINLRNLDAAKVSLGQMDELAADMPPSKLKARALVLGALVRRMQGDKTIGRAKLEAGLAMHVATGNIRGYWKSVMLSAELIHQQGDTLDSIALALRVLPDLRLHATSEELADQLDNLCVYYMSIGDHEAARPLVAECASVMPRDGNRSGMWCITQNAAELMVHDGKLETAALLLGFCDGRFSSWEDGRQVTEGMQRDRIVSLLGAAGMAEDEMARLLLQGRDLSPFEAEMLAGFKLAG